MTTVAAPVPTKDVGPTRSRSTTTGRVRRYRPRGSRMSPAPALTPLWKAAVSSAVPSPAAPKSRTVGGDDGSGSAAAGALKARARITSETAMGASVRMARYPFT